VLTFLQTGVTNAATEGTNRLIKQVEQQGADSVTTTTTVAAYASITPDHGSKRE
jgi:hypothetical protein